MTDDVCTAFTVMSRHPKRCIIIIGMMMMPRRFYLMLFFGKAE